MIILKTIAGILIVLIFTIFGIWLSGLLGDLADRIESAMNELGCLGEVLLLPLGVVFWVLVGIVALIPTTIGFTIADLLHLFKL